MLNWSDGLPPSLPWKTRFDSGTAHDKHPGISSVSRSPGVKAISVVGHPFLSTSQFLLGFQEMTFEKNRSSRSSNDRRARNRRMLESANIELISTNFNRGNRHSCHGPVLSRRAPAV